MARLIKADGSPIVDVFPEPGEAFTLTVLHAYVAGYIEIVRAAPPGMRATIGYLVVNEDGKGLGLPINERATVLYHAAGGARDDVIVGDAVLASWAELEGPEAEQPD